MEQAEILKEFTLPNGQKKVLTQEAPMLWRITMWEKDMWDFQFEEYTELTNAQEVFDLVTDINDLGKV